MNINPIQLLLGGGNPQQIIAQMVQNDPQAKAMLTQMQSSGMSNEQFVRQYAKQRNINIEPFLNMLRKKGVKF